MRPANRIPIYINLLRSKIGEEISLNSIFEFSKINEIDIKLCFSEKNLNELETIWKQNPDLRFSQLLVNTGFISNFPGLWYYTEDDKIMLKFGFEPREVLLWGTFGKNGDQQLKYKLIKDLDIDHIEAILKNVKVISEKYKKAFENELKYRKTLK